MTRTDVIAELVDSVDHPAVVCLRHKRERRVADGQRMYTEGEQLLILLRLLERASSDGSAAQRRLGLKS